MKIPKIQDIQPYMAIKHYSFEMKADIKLCASSFSMT